MTYRFFYVNSIYRVYRRQRTAQTHRENKPKITEQNERHVSKRYHLRIACGLHVYTLKSIWMPLFCCVSNEKKTLLQKNKQKRADGSGSAKIILSNE